MLVLENMALTSQDCSNARGMNGQNTVARMITIMCRVITLKSTMGKIRNQKEGVMSEEDTVEILSGMGTSERLMVNWPTRLELNLKI